MLLKMYRRIGYCSKCGVLPNSGQQPAELFARLLHPWGNDRPTIMAENCTAFIFQHDNQAREKGFPQPRTEKNDTTGHSQQVDSDSGLVNRGSFSILQATVCF